MRRLLSCFGLFCSQVGKSDRAGEKRGNEAEKCTDLQHTEAADTDLCQNIQDGITDKQTDKPTEHGSENNG